MNFVLASRSPARLATLRAAGLDPQVVVSRVDEDDVLARMPIDATPTDRVLALAAAKGDAVAAEVGTDSVIIACDSMFEMDRELRGKPTDEADAVRRLQQMRGNHGTLHTGHHVRYHDKVASAAAATEVHIGDMTDDEIASYVATGEPLHVAGSFTIDGLGGWFVERLDGDHTNVIGISLPLLRRMLRDVGVDVSVHLTPPFSRAEEQDRKGQQ